MTIDVIIVGGGPGGLSAALMLGRARKRVLVLDAGPPRNAAAEHVQGFLTRDGTPPAELRRIGREQLRTYPTVDVREARVDAIERDGKRFRVRIGAEHVEARRVLLCSGMIDAVPDLPGLREAWGKSVFQCPYCHAWEVQDRAFGVLATSIELLEFSLLLRGWTDDVVVLTSGAFPVPAELREKLGRAGVRIEERPVEALRHTGGKLESVSLAGGIELPRDVLFMRPPQRQTPLVTALGVTLDEQGYVRVDEHRQTSIPGVYAAGDVTTPKQNAIMAAADAAYAAAMLNHGLTVELLGV